MGLMIMDHSALKKNEDFGLFDGEGDHIGLDFCLFGELWHGA